MTHRGLRVDMSVPHTNADGSESQDDQLPFDRALLTNDTKRVAERALGSDNLTSQEHQM